MAAYFTMCKRLEVAEGIFPGHVDFSGSGIRRIGILTIAPDVPPDHDFFDGCSGLYPSCEASGEW